MRLANEVGVAGGGPRVSIVALMPSSSFLEAETGGGGGGAEAGAGMEVSLGGCGLTLTGG